MCDPLEKEGVSALPSTVPASISDFVDVPRPASSDAAEKVGLPENAIDLLNEAPAEEKQALLEKGTIVVDGRLYEIKEVVTAVVGSESIKRLEAKLVDSPDTLNMGLESFVNNLSEQSILEALYEQYLDAVQNFNALLLLKKGGKDIKYLYDENSTFEMYCKDALQTTKERFVELKQELATNKIDQKTYLNCKYVIEYNEGTLRKFLEGTIKFE